MDFNTCAQCGTEITDQGIHFRNRSFCGDECCEEFEAEFNTSDEPDEKDLSADDADDLDDDLGYRKSEDVEDDLDLDDYEIKPEDF